MSIRKRTWKGCHGKEKAAWVVDYRDAAGIRRSKQFGRKKDADAWHTRAAWQVSQGTHTPDTQSITVAKAAEHWLARARRENLEPTTVAAYEQQVRLHIKPLCGERKLSQLTKPIAEGYRDDLVENLSRPMAIRVMRSLTSIVAEAERRGYVARNVCAGVTVKRSRRHQSKVVIPSKSEMRAMIEAARASANPMDAPLVVTCIFCGPRASELRGMTWSQIDLKAATLKIDRRADAANVIGPPKSAAGHRVIPLAKVVVSELRKWRLRCLKSAADLVFPSLSGTVLSHRSLHMLHLWPVQVAVGLTTRSETGKNAAGRYASHALRHCAASLWIEQRVNPKRIQRWMGHSSIQVTFDTYGHLFEQAEADSNVMDAVEREILGS